MAFSAMQPKRSLEEFLNTIRLASDLEPRWQLVRFVPMKRHAVTLPPTFIQRRLESGGC